MTSAFIFSILLALLIIINIGIGSFRLNNREALTNNISTTKYNKYRSLADNPLYLATLNAANIEFLNNKLKEYRNVKGELAKVSKGEKQNAEALGEIAKKLQSAMGKLGNKSDPKNKKTLAKRLRQQS